MCGSVLAKIPLSAQASTRLPGASTTCWTVESTTLFTCTGGAVIKDDGDDGGGSSRDGLVLSLTMKEQQIYFIKLMMIKICLLISTDATAAVASF